MPEITDGQRENIALYVLDTDKNVSGPLINAIIQTKNKVQSLNSQVDQLILTDDFLTPLDLALEEARAELAALLSDFDVNTQVVATYGQEFAEKLIESGREIDAILEVIANTIIQFIVPEPRDPVIN